MSVYLYSGTPGSGKSYEAVNQVFNNLKHGHDVIANFAVKFDKKTSKYEKNFLFLENKDITVSKLLEIACNRGYLINKKEHQCTVIIDEAGGRYNCRKSCEKGEREDMTQWVDFFSQHMKMGYDFILIAQMDRMLDRQIRGVIESEFRFKKLSPSNLMNMMPFVTAIVFLPFVIALTVSGLTLFVKTEYWYHVKQKIGSSFIKYNDKKAKRYDRFKMFEGFAMSDNLRKIIAGQAVTDDNGSIDVIFVEPDETDRVSIGGIPEEGSRHGE